MESYIVCTFFGLASFLSNYLYELYLLLFDLAVACSFLLLYNIKFKLTLHLYTIIYISILQLMDSWVVASVWYDE